MPKPDKGKAFLDPAYGACLLRVTDYAHEPTPGFARSDYSRRQAFNADDTRLLIYALDGSWHLYDTATMRHLLELPEAGGDAEPQWDPSNPDLLYFLPTNGGLDLLELNVRSLRVRSVGKFDHGLPWSHTLHVWTRSEGSPSADARYWCFMADDDEFRSLGIFVWDKQTGTVLGTYPTNGNRPDHVSMSPSGRHCVASWDAPDGVWSFSRNMTREFQINSNGEHSDIALGTDGHDHFVSIDYQSNDGEVYATDLDTRMRTRLFPTYLNHTATAMHFSGKAFRKPGWVVMSTYASYDSRDRPFEPEWLHEKVFLVQLSPPHEIRVLAQDHWVSPHGWPVEDAGYWTEPQATVNRSLTRILFNSNWDDPSSAPDTYMIVLPADAVQ
jgi:hypothetical protein